MLREHLMCFINLLEVKPPRTTGLPSHRTCRDVERSPYTVRLGNRYPKTFSS